MMKSSEFIAKLKEVEKNKTVYALGMFGQPITASIIESKARQLPGWYTETKKAELKKLIGKGYFGFDCICLIKSILWGFNGDLNDACGGAKYGSNSVPDCGSENILNYCSGVSTDFSKIEAGEVVWMPGHVGVYIGNGQVIESTPKWKNGVQYTSLANIPKYKIGNYRLWAKHGKLPWIEYLKTSASVTTKPTNNNTATNEVIYKMQTLKYGSTGNDVTIFETIMKKMGYYNGAIDTHFGNGCVAACNAFQKKYPECGTNGKPDSSFGPACWNKALSLLKG